MFKTELLPRLNKTFPVYLQSLGWTELIWNTVEICKKRCSWRDLPDEELHYSEDMLKMTCPERKPRPCPIPRTLAHATETSVWEIDKSTCQNPRRRKQRDLMFEFTHTHTTSVLNDKSGLMSKLMAQIQKSFRCIKTDCLFSDLQGHKSS